MDGDIKSLSIEWGRGNLDRKLYKDRGHHQSTTYHYLNFELLELNVFKYEKEFVTESGQVLKEMEIAYSIFGKLNEKQDNVIWVVHALTANSDVSDWWAGIFGKGKILDPEKYFIVCANNLGSCYGSSNALSLNPATGSPYYHEFPLITIRDIANSLDLLRKHLKIDRIHLLMGGSQGGQVAMEWAIQQPKVFEHLFLIATNAIHSPWGIAFNESQRMAIEADATWRESHAEAGSAGLKAARAMALISYRNYQTYLHTQNDAEEEKTDRYKASSYQQYQGEKLQKRFHAFAYWTLSKAMDSHHVGRARGGLKKGLGQIRANTLVAGISSDILFPIEEQRFLAEHIPHASYEEIDSLFGHDGFLIENEKITALIRLLLEKKRLEADQSITYL